MSEENKTKSGVAGVLDTLKSNPKAAYAAIGAVVVVVFLLMSGGGDEVSPVKSVPVTAGQTVTIQNPNVGATILVSAPGLGSSADNEDDEKVLCRQVVAGTTATVEEEQTINYITFVKVTLKDGDCQGKTGWLPKVNIKAQ